MSSNVIAWVDPDLPQVVEDDSDFVWREWDRLQTSWLGHTDQVRVREVSCQPTRSANAQQP